MRHCAVMMLLVLAGCNTAPTAATLVLGHVSDRTRQDKAGEQSEQGIRLALHELNGEGALSEALGGRKIEVRHTDTRGSVDACEAEAVRLVSIHRCPALMGGWSAAETMALDHAQVPLLTFQGHKTPGTGNQVFYLGMSPAAQGKVLARHVAGTAEVKRLAILADESRGESTEFIRSFETTWSEARKTDEAKKDEDRPGAILTLRFGKEAKWGEVLERMRSHQPDALVFAGHVNDFNAWRRALHREMIPATTVPAEPRREALPREPLLIFAGDEGSARLFDRAPAAQARVILATAFVAESEKAQRFQKKYVETFHTEPDVHAALAYDGLRMLAEALKRAHPLITLERLRDELKNTKDFEGLTGPCTVTDDRQVQRPLFVVRWDNDTLRHVKTFP